MRKVASVRLRVRASGGDWQALTVDADAWASMFNDDVLRGGDEFVVEGVDYE